MVGIEPWRSDDREALGTRLGHVIAGVFRKLPAAEFTGMKVVLKDERLIVTKGLLSGEPASGIFRADPAGRPAREHAHDQTEGDGATQKREGSCAESHRERGVILGEADQKRIRVEIT
jgi:hypothetical protein